MKKALNLAMVLGLAAGLASAHVPNSTATDREIAEQAAREIRMYTRYTIWDHVEVGVREGMLELSGQVSQPFKRKDLERIVAKVPGVTSVANTLTVLPVSFYDDQLRIQVARAIYRDNVLSRYALQPVPPIHIIVNNGRVSLEGVVNNEMEKNIATMRASSAGLSFGPVVNNLRVERPRAKS